LFNFTGNLYNKELSVEIIRHLRDEIRFSSKHALINQILMDIKQAKAFFKNKSE
jgi:riboflavin kinase/FMN adenylyltransferase